MIKFRAWVKPGVLSNHLDGVIAEAKPDFIERVCLVKRDDLIGNECFNEIFDFDDLILMQSTGLKDKNGVEIFEGDVLRVYEIDDTVGESEYISPVIWKDYGWLVYDTDTDIPLCLLDRDSDFGDRDVEIEILGNIHANPELAS